MAASKRSLEDEPFSEKRKKKFHLKLRLSQIKYYFTVVSSLVSMVDLFVETSNEISKLDQQDKGANNQKLSILHQISSWCFYLLLDEECRAYLIDSRSEWLGNRPKNWYTNIEVGSKTLLFLVDLCLGLIWSRLKRFNPMSRKPKF